MTNTDLEEFEEIDREIEGDDLPSLTNPKCVQCEKQESPMWRKVGDGHICNDCYERNCSNLKDELEPDNENGTNINCEEKQVRKSTRATRYKSLRGSTNYSKTIPKGKSRRNIFKKTSYKSPTVTATTTTVDNLFYNGSYMQVGDIVSLIDAKDNIYYAQIRGLMVDTFCEKSVFITWLIPTKSSPPPNERFDPSTYLIGFEEEHPRLLSCVEFVMHAPSTYYHNKNTPYPAPEAYQVNKHIGQNSAGFIWTNLSESVKPTNNRKKN